MGGMDVESVIKSADPEGVDNISESDDESEKNPNRRTQCGRTATPKYIKPTPKLEKDGNGVFIKDYSILDDLGDLGTEYASFNLVLNKVVGRYSNSVTRDIASSSNFVCGGCKCINSKQLCTCKGECYI